MSKWQYRLRIWIPIGLSAVVFIIFAIVVRARMLEIHRPTVEKRRAVEVEIERTGRGEVLYETAEGYSKLVRRGDADKTLSWWALQLGDRPVRSILFYLRSLTPKDLDDASLFPEADIYVWTIANEP